MMSSAATVVVHPTIDVLLMALPLAKAGSAPAVIVLALVGSAVPLATFHTSKVIVGEDPLASIDQPTIVQASVARL
jgi:hypothetical protein